MTTIPSTAWRTLSVPSWSPDLAVLLIAGAGTDVGKTYITAQLIRALRDRGEAVDALKPVVSGFDPDDPADSDPARLLDALGRRATPEELARISPWRFRAPLSPHLAARREARPLDGRAVIAHCRDTAAAAPPGSWLLVETAGGIMSPLDETLTMLDLAMGLAAPVLLVGGAYLGAISHVLTAASVLRASGLAPRAVVISQAPGATVDVLETAEAVSARLPGTVVLPVGRDADAADGILAAMAGPTGRTTGPGPR